MPTFRFKLPIFDAVLLLGGGSALVSALALRDSPVRDVLAGVAASFAFFLLTRFIGAVEQLISLRRFKRFFGAAATSEKFGFIYPNFVLNAAVTSTITEAGISPQGIYTKRRSAFNREYRIDIPECVAINDIEALSRFVSLFGEIASISPRLVADEKALDDTSGFLSFGLSSNELTHMYLDYLDSPLFELVEDKEAERFGEFLRVPTADGEPRDFVSSEKREIGIFVRATPYPNAPHIKWLICAGVGPAATIGVAYYISENWKQIDKLVRDEDFIAIISVPPYATKQSKLDWLSTARQVLLSTEDAE